MENVLVRYLTLFISLLFVAGCQASSPSSSKGDSKNPWWSLSFVEPLYMTVWVEDTAVEDINGKIFHRTGGGTAAESESGDESEPARGWSNKISGGTRGVVGADLPKRIYVRWQSIVEPQTYHAWVEISAEARQILSDSTNERCPARPEEPANYRAKVYLGLAPGGIVQAWVLDKCMKPIKVARVQADVELLGPSQGKNEGRYAYPVSEESKLYIERYGIPYGSW